MKVAKKNQQAVEQADFHSQQCVVVLRNITKSTDLAKGQRPEITGLGPRELTLLLPATACSEGNLLLVRIFDEEVFQRIRSSPRSVQDKAQRLAITAKVSKIEAAPAPNCLATLELQQPAAKDWQAFVKTFGPKATPGLKREIAKKK